MGNCAVLLNLSKATMVVGKQQAFVGDELSGTSTSKKQDGIFQAAVVYRIDILSCDFHAHFLHFLFVHLLEQHGYPHAFAGHERSNKLPKEQGDQRGYFLYHLVVILFSAKLFKI